MRNALAIAMTALLCAACGSDSEERADVFQSDWFSSYQSDPMIFAARAATTTSPDDDELARPVTSGPRFY